MTGVIFNIQNYSVTDGPGIRTLVFFKGCPLRCRWCENPESLVMHPQLAFHGQKCVACKRCRIACPHGAIEYESGTRVNWSKCDNCGNCVDACNADALEMIGRNALVEEILREVGKDDAFYRRSGGGVTVSGGEATLQYDFLYALLEALKRKRYHVVLETCGFVTWEKLAALIPLVDIFYYDIKGIDPRIHRESTGVDNALILENARKLIEYGANVVFRIPIVPGINDGNRQLDALKQYLVKVNAIEVHLLPYHRLGESKLNEFRTDQSPLDIQSMNEEALLRIKEQLSHEGIVCFIGGK